MVATFYPPHHFGGDALQTYRLANELARRGHRVTIVHSPAAHRALAPDGPIGSFPNEPGVTLLPIETPLGRPGLLASYLAGRPVLESAALRRALGGPFDVVHFQNVSLLGGPGVLGLGDAVKLYTLNEHWLVCPMHVLWRMNREPCERPTCVRCALAHRRPPQPWRRTGALERALAEIDAFLSPSRFAIESHRARGFTHPIVHLPHFLGRAEVEAAPAGVGPSLRRPYFLFAGRLERMKGVQVLLERFSNYDAADLVIAGDGAFSGELRRRAVGLPHVHFLGRVDPSQLRTLYAGAIALLVPSIGYEVFGLVVLEAFAHGTPVIAHDLGALPELITESGGGWTYRTPGELLDAMEHARLDPPERERRGALGRATWLAHYTEEEHVPAYLELVQELRRR
jgi:glycosyltransferase involved in cell wall biosynthesis